MGSGARLPLGPTAEAEAVPMLGTHSLLRAPGPRGPAGDTSEPRCSLRIKSEHLPEPRRPRRPCLPQGLLFLLTHIPRPPPQGGALFCFSIPTAFSTCSPSYKPFLLPARSSLRAQLNPVLPRTAPQASSVQWSCHLLGSWMVSPFPHHALVLRGLSSG